MAKKRGTRKKRTDTKERVNKILQYTDLTNKQLAKKLGVSSSTLYRYKTGKTSPRNKKVTQKLNRTYKNFEYLFVSYCTISDYIDQHNLNDSDINIDLLLNLSDEGYVCGWSGGSSIPLEVEFLANGWGSELNNNGYFFNIVAIVGNLQSPKLDKKGNLKMPKEYKYLRMFTVTRGELKIKPSTGFEQRMNICRDWLMGVVFTNFHVMPIALLGYFINEKDIL